MTALFAKATALALVQHPVVNSSCRDGNSFTYNSSINIAVAVAIDGGLITPVLQDADKVDIYTLSRKWKELVDKARATQSQPHEYNTDDNGEGGTFALYSLFCRHAKFSLLPNQQAFDEELSSYKYVSSKQPVDSQLNRFLEKHKRLRTALLVVVLFGIFDGHDCSHVSMR